MRVNEAAVEIDRLLVVLGCFSKLTEDEVELSPVVVDVRIILVVSDGKFKVILGGVLVSYLASACDSEEEQRTYNSPSSRCKLARLT
jgi:hypothetical protein